MSPINNLCCWQYGTLHWFSTSFLANLTLEEASEDSEKEEEVCCWSAHTWNCLEAGSLTGIGWKPLWESWWVESSLTQKCHPVYSLNSLLWRWLLWHPQFVTVFLGDHFFPMETPCNHPSLLWQLINPTITEILRMNRGRHMYSVLVTMTASCWICWPWTKFEGGQWKTLVSVPSCGCQLPVLIHKVQWSQCISEGRICSRLCWEEGGAQSFLCVSRWCENPLYELWAGPAATDLVILTSL